MAKREPPMTGLGFSPILDVRGENDFAAGHAAGAVNIPAQELAQRMHELPPKGATIRLFDTDGDRLAIVAYMLRTRGYEVEEARLSARELEETGPSAARLWQPSPFLAETLDWIESPAEAAASDRPARALDLACGAGREAVHLALRGYQVDAVDTLPDALQRAEDLARRYGAAIHTIRQDLKRQPFLPNEAYDLVAVFRFLYRPLLPAIARCVAPGGFVVYETFHEGDVGRRGCHGLRRCVPQTTFRQQPGRERGLPQQRANHGTAGDLRDGELAAAFEGFERIILREGDERDGRCFSQLLARKPAARQLVPWFTAMFAANHVPTTAHA